MRIETGSDAVDILAPLLASAGEERLAVVHLGPEGRLIGVTLEQPGGPDAVDLPVHAVLAAALKLGAEAILVAHNHPSGDPTPSDGDIAATRALAAAAAAAGIGLADHLVFAGGDCRSFRALGLL